jgi:Ca-activated chloride channel family protein
MKRTALFFAIAGAVGLLALFVALVPQATTSTTVAPPPVVPNVSVTPPGPQQAGDALKLSAALSDPYLVLGGQREAFLKIDLDAVRREGTDRAAVNLAIVLDRSGSMAGEKIEQCRRAARHLVQQLDGRDRFALISFGSDVTQVISSTLATPAAKQQMLSAIDGIVETGGTNLSGGLEAGLAELIAYRSQYNVSRIILLSDGQANEGISDPRGLAAIA